MYMDCNAVRILCHHIKQTHKSRFIYFIQNICMFKYFDWVILIIFFWNGGMYHICPLLLNIISMFMMSRWPQSFLMKLIILRSDGTRFYIYISYIYLFYQVYLLPYDAMFTTVIYSETNHFMSWYNLVLCVYISIIYLCYSQICMDEYFDSN